MAIYLQIQGINGDVSAKNYKHWINLESFNFSVKRTLSTRPGRVVDREGTRPSISEITIAKHTDKSSPLLFGEACTGQAKPNVKIVFCTTNDSLSPYLEYTLSNVIVSSYTVNTRTESDDKDNKTHHPHEIITLNFDKVEMKFTPFDEKHQAQSPIPSGYDLKQATAT
jgi:type VI secretion system secreted protein Hcp